MLPCLAVYNTVIYVATLMTLQISCECSVCFVLVADFQPRTVAACDKNTYKYMYKFLTRAMIYG